MPRLVVDQKEDKDIKGAGVEGQNSLRAGPEGGGGGPNKLESQSEKSTFNFDTGPSRAGKI